MLGDAHFLSLTSGAPKKSAMDIIRRLEPFPRGEVTESCRANLVAAIAGRLLTPPLSCGLLPGVFRERLLARGVVAEAMLRPADLALASRLWLVNSVRFWTPAVLAAPGPDGDAGASGPLDADFSIC